METSAKDVSMGAVELCSVQGAADESLLLNQDLIGCQVTWYLGLLIFLDFADQTTLSHHFSPNESRWP